MSNNLSLVIGDAHPILFLVSFLGVSSTGPYLAFSLSSFVSPALLFPITRRVAHRTLKTCIATISPKIGGRSSFSARKPSSVFITLGF